MMRHGRLTIVMVVTTRISLAYSIDRRLRSAVVSALDVDYPPPEGVERSLAPGPAGAPPPDLAVPGAPVESEPVPADVDAHLALLAEAVRREAVDAGADEADCNNTNRQIRNMPNAIHTRATE